MINIDVSKDFIDNILKGNVRRIRLPLRNGPNAPMTWHGMVTRFVLEPHPFDPVAIKNAMASSGMAGCNTVMVGNNPAATSGPNLVWQGEDWCGNIIGICGFDFQPEFGLSGDKISVSNGDVSLVLNITYAAVSKLSFKDWKSDLDGDLSDEQKADNWRVIMKSLGYPDDIDDMWAWGLHFNLGNTMEA